MSSKLSHTPPAGQVEAAIHVAAFYQFLPLENLPELQQKIRNVCDESELMGTILLADEGINGTIAGPGNGVDA